MAAILANARQNRPTPDQPKGLMSTPAPTVRDTIKGYFPDEAVVDGLLANAEHESRLDHTAFEYKPEWKPDEKGNMPDQGYGLFQFTGRQLEDYVDWLTRNEAPDSLDAQVQFVYDNIYTNSQGVAGPHDIGGEARNQLQNDFRSGDPGRIARSFALNYEKMADAGQADARAATANAYFPDRKRTRPTAYKPTAPQPTAPRPAPVNLALPKNTARKPFPPGTYGGIDANMTLVHPGPKNLIR